jgi:hypothetical protein
VTGNVANLTTPTTGKLDIDGVLTINAGANAVTINILGTASNLTNPIIVNTTGTITTTTPAAPTITVNDVTGDNIVNIADGTGPFTLTGSISGGNTGLVYVVELDINGVKYTTTVTRTDASSDAFTITGVTLNNLVSDGDKTIEASVTTDTNFGTYTPTGSNLKTYDVN